MKLRRLSESDLRAIEKLVGQENGYILIVCTSDANETMLDTNIGDRDVLEMLLTDMAKRRVADYCCELPNAGRFMTVEQFKEDAANMVLIDLDGHGHPTKDGRMAKDVIYPSASEHIPSDADHIVWFSNNEINRMKEEEDAEHESDEPGAGFAG